MKNWGQIFHETAFALMGELERIAPDSPVLIEARRTFELGQDLGARPRAQMTRREILIEKIQERDRQDATARRLYLRGWTMEAVGNELGGKSYEWVRRSLERTGTPTRHRGRQRKAA